MGRGRTKADRDADELTSREEVGVVRELDARHSARRDDIGQESASRKVRGMRSAVRFGMGVGRAMASVKGRGGGRRPARGKAASSPLLPQGEGWRRSSPEDEMDQLRPYSLTIATYSDCTNSRDELQSDNDIYPLLEGCTDYTDSAPSPSPSHTRLPPYSRSDSEFICRSTCCLPPVCTPPPAPSSELPSSNSSVESSFIGAATFAIRPLDLDLLPPPPPTLSPSVLPSARPPARL